MAGSILAASVEGIEYLKFKGVVRYSHCGGLEAYIDQLFDSEGLDAVVIDLEEAEILDSTALGLLARIAIEYKKISAAMPVIFLKRGELDKIIKRVCFDQVFHMVYDDLDIQATEFKELVDQDQNEEQVLQRVLQAHRHLATISRDNESLYRDITLALN